MDLASKRHSPVNCTVKKVSVTPPGDIELEFLNLTFVGPKLAKLYKVKKQTSHAAIDTLFDLSTAYANEINAEQVGKVNVVQENGIGFQLIALDAYDNSLLLFYSYTQLEDGGFTAALRKYYGYKKISEAELDQLLVVPDAVQAFCHKK